jgi:hypothetical protein
MKQVFFSAASVLLLILIASAIAFNPFTVNAQIEHIIPPDIPINQPLKPSSGQGQEIKTAINDIKDTAPAILSKEAFEKLHKDENLIFEINERAVKVNKDFSYQLYVKKRAKILNESAIQTVGELSLPYDSSRQAITSLKAHTIAPDGTIYPAASIQDFSRYELAMYSDMRVKVISFSNVTVGSQLEYEVIMEAKHTRVKGAYFEDYYFNFTIPTKEQNIIFSFPKEHDIKYKEYNLSYKPEITEDDENITYAWHLVNMYEEPLRESMLPYNRDDLLTDAVQFSSIKSWDDVSKWYYALIEKNLIVSDEIANTAKAITKGHEGIRLKTRAILEYLQKDFRYVSMGFGDNSLEPHKTTEVFYNKYGDCKDLSLLCMALLKAADIDSSIALFNTEDSITDPEKDLPFPTLFDHVILLVRDPEKGDFFIDPLLKGYDIEEYPFYFQRAYTFVVGKEKGEFKRLPVFPKERDYKESNFIIDIGPDGSSTYQNNCIWDLDFSIKTRNRNKSMSDEEKTHMYEYLENTIAEGGDVLAMSINGLDNDYGPLNSYTKVFNKDEYPIIDSMIIIDLNAYGRGDGFNMEERTYPIFYPFNAIDKMHVRYNIPKGFRVTHLPEDLSLDNGIFSLKRTFKKGRGYIIMEEIEETKRTELPKEEYQRLKEFNDALPKKTTQRIVLTKKKGFWNRLFGR